MYELLMVNWIKSFAQVHTDNCNNVSSVIFFVYVVCSFTEAGYRWVLFAVCMLGFNLKLTVWLSPRVVNVQYCSKRLSVLMKLRIWWRREVFFNRVPTALRRFWRLTFLIPRSYKIYKCICVVVCVYLSTDR